MDELDNILSNIDLEEEKQDAKGDYADEWWCTDCEHGPMMDGDTNCSRCGAKHSSHHEEEMTGWEEEDEMEGVEEIW